MACAGSVAVAREGRYLLICVQSASWDRGFALLTLLGRRRAYFT